MIVDLLTYYRFLFLILHQKRGPSECDLLACIPDKYDCVSQRECAERKGYGTLSSLFSKKSKVCCALGDGNLTDPALLELGSSTKNQTEKIPTSSQPAELLLEYNDLKKLNFTSHRNAHLLPNDNCGFSNYDEKLAQGKEAKLGDFPWMALIGENGQGNFGNDTFFCGGTLIHDYYVLTAAHCATHNTHKMDFVRLGEYDLREEIDCFKPAPGQSQNTNRACFPKYKDIPIEEVILHENWRNDSSFRDDIALIRLSQNASDKEHEDSIKSICLPLDASIINFLASRKYEVAGWGKTHWTSNTVSDVLMRSERGIAPLSLEECNTQVCDNAREKEYCPISKNQICVQDRYQLDICQGDSGGPMMYLSLSPERSQVLWYQVGIVSFKSSDDCGRRKVVPSIFTNVVPYMPWILENIRE